MSRPRNVSFEFFRHTQNGNVPAHELQLFNHSDWERLEMKERELVNGGQEEAKEGEQSKDGNSQPQPTDQEQENQNQLALKVEFSLKSSEYATMVLRELMRCETGSGHQHRKRGADAVGADRTSGESDKRVKVDVDGKKEE